MGRVLPSLSSRVGAAAPTMIAPTREQQMKLALRQAAQQRAARLSTPEGFLGTLAKGAQSLSSIVGAGEKIASAIGKIPISEAMRNAAAAKASRDLVVPGAQETFMEVAEEQGIGQGAPVTQEVAESIQEVGTRGPSGRLAAEALKKGALEGIAMRDWRERSKAADTAVDEAVEYMLPSEKPEDKDVELGMAPDVDVRETIAEEMVDQPEQAAAADQVRDATLEGVEVTTEGDKRSVQMEAFVGSLGTTPVDRQSKLLGLARNAYDPEKQGLLLEAVEYMDVAPGTRVSDLFADPREAFKNQMLAQFPKRSEVLRAQKDAAIAARAAEALTVRKDFEGKRQKLREERLALAAKNFEAGMRLKMDKHRFDKDRDYRRFERNARLDADRRKRHADIIKLRREALDGLTKSRKARGATRKAAARKRNFRNLKTGIDESRRHIVRITRDVSVQARSLQTEISTLKRELSKYKNKMSTLGASGRGAYRRMLESNDGVDPYIKGTGERLGSLEGEQKRLKKSRRTLAKLNNQLDPLSQKTGQAGERISEEVSEGIWDDLSAITNSVDELNIFGEPDAD